MRHPVIVQQPTLKFEAELNNDITITKSMPNDELAWRPIHYLGSKLRIVELINEIVDDVDPSNGPVCDLFSGSGTVSNILANSRKVIAVDIQEYSRVICSALLHPPIMKETSAFELIDEAFATPTAKEILWAINPMLDYESLCLQHAMVGNLEPLCEMIEHGSIISYAQKTKASNNGFLMKAISSTMARLDEIGKMEQIQTMITRYYGGIYFSYLHAAQLDIMLELVASLPSKYKDTFLAAVLSTASDLVNTVGKQFAQPIQPRCPDGTPKPNLYKRVVKDRKIDALNTFKTWVTRYLQIKRRNRDNLVLKGDYLDVLDSLKDKVSVVYADPPYTRDHYSRYYHVLETLCLRDNPALSTIRIGGALQVSRGIYRQYRHQSPFCIKSTAPKAFSALFEKVSSLKVPLVLSYSPYKKETGGRPRLMHINDITALAKKWFPKVSLETAGRVSHSKLNRTDMNKEITYDAEKIIICSPF